MQVRARQARNSPRMAELYPWFAEKLSLVIGEIEADGLRPRIQDAWRPVEDQLKAFNAGHSELKFGFDNVTSQNGEREALAVDLLDDTAPFKPSAASVLKLAAAAERHGLTTGARWGLPTKVAKAINAAIQNKIGSRPQKLGSDPAHVEPAGFSVEQAAAGWHLRVVERVIRL